MEELKPCPFCNNKAKIEGVYDEFYTIKMWKVRCSECWVMTYPDTKEKVINLWNTRKENESGVEADAESRCPNCGESDPVLCCENCGHKWSRTT